MSKEGLVNSIQNYVFPANVLCLSVAKSGRTWIRSMLNHYYYLLYPLSVTSRNYQYKDKIPLIYYTHGGKQVPKNSDRKSIIKRIRKALKN